METSMAIVEMCGGQKVLERIINVHAAVKHTHDGYGVGMHYERYRDTLFKSDNPKPGEQIVPLMPALCS